MAGPSRIVADLKLFSRGYIRTRIGLFFSLVFPIILILLFGAIFSGGNGGPIPVSVQNQDNGGYGGQFVDALNKTGTIKPTLVGNSVDFKQYLLDHSSSEGVQIPSNFTSSLIQGNPVSVTVYSNPTDTSSGIVFSVVNGVVNGFNYKQACPTCVPVVSMNQLPITSRSAKYI